jgi:surface protein
VCFSQFITTWETTSASESISIPMTGTGYSVDWGDFSSTTESGTATHVYTSAGTYIVTITGPYTRINFNNSGDKDKIMSIDSWGTNAWTNLSNAFYGCSNLVNKASDTPNLTSATRLTGMFRNATSIGNSDTMIDSGNWSWVTTGIERMNNIFYGASSFNKDIGGWDTSSVDRMNNMFRGASAFNQDISEWDVEEVTTMATMFRDATLFNNGDVALSWTTTKLQSINNLFRGATAFNQDISGWTTTALTSMNNTFRNATSFDQDIGGWDISNITTMNNTFNGATLSANNYNALLIGWEPQIPALLTGVIIELGTSKYCSPDAITAKADIIANRSWIFNDGGVLTSFTWTGGTDTEWNDFTNWQDGYDSACEIDISVPALTNDPIINTSTAIIANNLTIDSGASLTVEGALTVNDLITNNGLTISSGGSIIVSGTSTGNLSYNRFLANAIQWYYVSSPVEGETIEDYIGNNSLQEGNSNTGFFYYDNDTTLGFAGTGYVFYTPTSTGSFTTGKGYGTQVSSPSNIIFTGTMPTGNKLIPIATGSIDKSNLIGNPFPSYLPTDTLLTENTGVLNEETIWLWDNTISDYVVINIGSPSHFIPPGQGFFVDSTVSGGDFDFLESWQEHQTSDVFYRSSDTTFRININLSNENNLKKITQIFFIEDKTVLFDNGYDSTSYSDESESLIINTKLVSNHNSEDLAIQTLPKENTQNFIIPLFVKGSDGLTFEAITTNKPTDVTIILEDRLLNTFTTLNSATKHTVDVGDLTTGVGRFYLHTKHQSLSLENNILNSISIYTTENKTLNISGLPNKETKIVLFNILGKELVKDVFLADNSTKEISLLGLKNGIYIIKVETETEVISKKIILK